MTKQQLQEAIEQRESEVSGYQVNIDNYTRMLAELPCAWPDNLIDFKGKEISFIVGAVESETALNLAADLIFHDKLQITLRTEKLEQRKAILVLKIHKDQLEEHENVLSE